MPIRVEKLQSLQVSMMKINIMLRLQRERSTRILQRWIGADGQDRFSCVRNNPSRFEAPIAISDGIGNLYIPNIQSTTYTPIES